MAAIVAALAGRTKAAETDVQMTGGTLTVGFQRNGEAVSEVFLEGPTETVYRGSFEWNP